MERIEYVFSSAIITTIFKKSMIACFSGCSLAKSENRHKHSKPGRYDEPVAEQQGCISVTESWECSLGVLRMQDSVLQFKRFLE